MINHSHSHSHLLYSYLPNYRTISTAATGQCIPLLIYAERSVMIFKVIIAHLLELMSYIVITVRIFNALSI